ncbi:hypothetical protein [Nostoc sp. DedQUE12b]|uniref:hypothetical protein n=1 Tax=Nostoc sp. DedQUE12b TaxID=3075398 RepID=UPI002AD4B2E5|nr:hypothetical protein [Nostoc sp. DedQUE12b]
MTSNCWWIGAANFGDRGADFFRFGFFYFDSGLWTIKSGAFGGASAGARFTKYAICLFCYNFRMLEWKN